jgi:hypothetical protein
MKHKLFVSLSLALIAAMLVTSLAAADPIINNIDTTVDSTLESRTITPGGSTMVGFFIVASNNDPSPDASGCNATGSNPAIVTLDVPSEVTATPSSFQIVGCDNVVNTTFSSDTVGSYEISIASVTGGKSGSQWNMEPASFTLNVASLDNTAPVITPNISGSLGNNGWYVSDVTVSWMVSDDESAISSSSGCDPTTINSDTAGTTLTCSATSAGGNSGQSVTIMRDATPPTISGSAAPAPNGAGWNNSDVTVSFTCGDNLSGIASCGPNQTLSGEGAGQSATGTAVDSAGNTASSTVSGINIDKIAPSIIAALDKSPAVTGWFNTNIGAPTVNFTCSDALSGLAGPCPSSYTFGEGTDQAYSQTIYDLAGNSASAGVSDVDVDLIAPSITITTPAAGASFVLNQVIAANYGCLDATSGIDTCAGPVSNGSNIDTASAGPKSFTVNASDLAGNTNSATNSYSVNYALCILYDQSKAHKSGSTVPLKLQLCDVNGVNYSSASIVVKAISLTRLDTSASSSVEDSGNANPDQNFRYDATLGGTGGYIFNLSTKGLSSGTWKVTFTVDGQGSYSVQFDVK